MLTWLAVLFYAGPSATKPEEREGLVFFGCVREMAEKVSVYEPEVGGPATLLAEGRSGPNSYLELQLRRGVGEASAICIAILRSC